MLSAIVPENRKLSCSTSPTDARSVSKDKLAQVNAVEQDGAIDRVVETREQLAMVVLPAPVWPTRAIRSPGSAWKFTSSSTGSRP